MSSEKRAREEPGTAKYASECTSRKLHVTLWHGSVPSVFPLQILVWGTDNQAVDRKGTTATFAWHAWWDRIDHAFWNACQVSAGMPNSLLSAISRSSAASWNRT